MSEQADGRLTQRWIDRAKRGDRSRTRVCRCHEVPGFSVSVHAKRVSFDFEYRPGGRDPSTGKRRNTQVWHIGDDTTFALAEAREIARGLRREVQRGVDPKRAAAEAATAAEAERRAIAAPGAARLTCQDRLGLYRAVLETRGRSPRYQAEDLRQVVQALKSVNGLELLPAEITPAVIEKMLAACPKRSRSTRFGALHRFLSWTSKGSGSIAPTLLFDRHERPKPPAARRRVLNDAEIAALWRAGEALPNDAPRDLVQLLLVIPARRGEAAQARWRDLDIDAKVWHQPTSKNDDPHDFPLNDRAVAVLQRRRAATGAHRDDFVFPGPRHNRPFCGWTNLTDAIAARIAAATPVADWRLHDFRRTCVTHLAEQGHDETLLDLLINHRAARSRSGVRGVYQRAVRWPERVAALKAWSELLDKYLGENVTALRRVG